MASEHSELAKRAMAGDRSAFRALVDATHRTAFRVALRTIGDKAEAEDALQEAYLKVWSTRERLRAPEAAHSWVYGIVRNVASNRARGRSRRSAHEEPGDAEQLAALARGLTCEQPGPEQAVADAQMRGLLMKVVSQLDENHRIVLLLRVVDGMSYDELAETLGVPLGTVESRLHRARQELVKRLERALCRSFGESG